jgi:hypothetical protein
MPDMEEKRVARAQGIDVTPPAGERLKRCCITDSCREVVALIKYTRRINASVWLDVAGEQEKS